MNNRQIKVGLFLLAGLIVSGILIFIVGEQRHLFDHKVRLNATFHDVGGLAVGGPVRMGGVDIGQIEAITFGQDPTDRNIHVRFSIVSDQLVRVRSDTIARIVSKGLLGDKALDLTMGTARLPQVAEGGSVHTEETDDLTTALHSASEALGRANHVLENVVIATQPFANEQLGNDVLATVHDLRTIAHQVAAGPGTVHTLLTDPSAAQRLDQTLGSAEIAANRLASASGDVQAILREARGGHGLVHALVYDPAGDTMVQSLSTTAREIGDITHDVRTGNGGLHQIIYGQDSGQMVVNINQATADLRDIIHDVRQGRGTIGALLVDPSLYEDIKSLVGNIQRNEILRSLVRYSIHNDEHPREGVVAQPAPGAPPPAPPPAATGANPTPASSTLPLPSLVAPSVTPPEGPFTPARPNPTLTPAQ